jgi:hypothetical protein
MAASATFTLGLQQNVSGPAASAGAAILALDAKMQGMKSRMSELNGAMKDLKGGGMGDIAKGMSPEMDKLRQQMAEAQNEFQQLGGKNALAGAKLELPTIDTGEAGGLTTIVTGTMEAKAGFMEMATAAGVWVGPAISAAKQYLAIVGMVAGAMVGLAKSFIEFGIKAASSFRDAKIELEGMVLLSRRGGSTADGMTASIMRFADETGMTVSEVTALNNELYAAGLRGGALEAALEKASTFSAATGKSASEFLALGGSVGMLNGKMAAFAELAKRRMLGMDKQVAKFKDNLSKLFSKININPFLEGLKEVLDLFSENTRTGKELAALCEIMFSPLLAVAKPLGTFLKNMFRGALLAAMLLTAGLLMLAVAIKKVIPPSVLAQFKSLGKGWNMVKVAAIAGAAVFGVALVSVIALAAGMALLAIGAGALAVVIGIGLAGALALCMIPVALLGLAFVVLAAMVILPIVAVGLVIYAFFRLGEMIGEGISGALDAVSGFAEGAMGFLSMLGPMAVSAAGSLIDGLINGITSGASAVMGAVGNLASGITSGLKGALGIASPSKVFAGLGANVSEGFAIGIDKNAPMAEESIGSMAGGTVSAAGGASAAGAASGAASGKAGGNTYNITISGVANAEDLKSESFMDRIAEAFERAAASAGMEPAHA